MQIKVQNRKVQNFSIIFVFEVKNTCFLLIPVKFVAVLRKIKFLKNPRWRPKWQACCENGVAMATVFNQNLIFVMESKELIQSYLHAKA